MLVAGLKDLLKRETVFAADLLDLSERMAELRR